MKYRWTLLLLPLMALAHAGEHKKMEIKVMRDDGAGVVEFNSADLDFDLFAMQVGENRSVVDKDGQTMLITRTADGFDLEAGGDTIKIPDPGKIHSADDIGHNVDVDVRHKKVMVHDADEADAIIMTREAIDEETQKKIQSLLESAGVDGDVRFVDGIGKEQHVIKDVRVIREKAE